MGDDAHQPPPLAQLSEGLYRFLQRFVIQGAEPLVHKHGVQLHPSGERQDLVRQSQRQRYLSIQPLAL